VILTRTSPTSQGGYSDYKTQFGNYDGEHPELEKATVCKVNIRGMSEFASWNELAEGVGSLLLPISVLGSVRRQDRFKMTHKYEAELSSPFLFDIVGEPRVALVGLKADIRLIPE